MLRLFLFIVLLLFTSQASFATSGNILKLSLETQMKLQTIQYKKAANITKLAELRAQKKSSTQANNNSNNRTAIQQANLARIAELRAQKSTTKNIISASVIKTNYASIGLTSQPEIAGVDMNRVRTTWAGWYNSYRQSLGLGQYTYDSRLDNTAYAWNIEFAKGKGQNHHRRNPGDTYYDYPIITEWLKERGVVGKVINGATTTENVGWGSYRCSSSDCTNSLINAIRSTYDFFMSEKSYNGSHYKSIVQPNFTKIGLSVVVVPEESRYYLVVHYITDFQ